jgi:hypothetical protein
MEEAILRLSRPFCRRCVQTAGGEGGEGVCVAPPYIH